MTVPGRATPIAAAGFDEEARQLARGPPFALARTSPSADALGSEVNTLGSRTSE